MSHPEHTGAMKERRLGSAEQCLPQLERPNGPASVDFIGSVSHTNDARFPSRTGTAVGGTISVQKDHLLAGTLQVISSPGAKDTGADNSHIVALAGPDLTGSR